MIIGDVPPTFFKIYWLVWLVIGFGGMEFYAIKTAQYEGTLSYFAWWVLGAGAESRDWFRWFARAFIVGLLVWLVPHLLNGWGWFK